MFVRSDKTARSPFAPGIRNTASENETATVHPCLEKDLSCGEGGCMVNKSTGGVVCLCVDLRAPDENGNCPPNEHQTLPPSHIPLAPDLPWPGFNPKPGEDFRPRPTMNNPNLPTKTAGQGPGRVESNGIRVDTAAVLIPISIVFLFFIAAALLFLLRHRLRTRRRQNEHRDIYKQDRSQLLDNMAVVGKNQNYALYVDLYTKLNTLHVTNIPREQLKLMEEIGEGAFGKVYRGEVIWPNEEPTFVAVKILKQDASLEVQNDFLREVQIMCSFSHDNILSLLGIVSVDGCSPLMVFELMEHGDLTELLRKNDPSKKGSHPLQLKKVDLVDIATQIANGMSYLSDQHFIHRDLATRNCLVGTELRVKISDFGMSRDIYTCDYYKIGGARLLPVRWMSPESIKYGRFTSESDVWSFGVTLWEIFTYGKQPYYGHANEEVIRLLDDGILLQRPDHCPDEVFSIMLACWRTDVKQRFTFKRIYHHLRDVKNRHLACYQPRSFSTHSDRSVQLHYVHDV